MGGVLRWVETRGEQGRLSAITGRRSWRKKPATERVRMTRLLRMSLMGTDDVRESPYMRWPNGFRMCILRSLFAARRGWPPATASLPAAAALQVGGVLAQRGGRAAERGRGAGKAEG